MPVLGVWEYYIACFGVLGDDRLGGVTNEGKGIFVQ